MFARAGLFVLARAFVLPLWRAADAMMITAHLPARQHLFDLNFLAGDFSNLLTGVIIIALAQVFKAAGEIASEKRADHLMPIIVTLDVMLAKRKMRSRDLAQRIGIAEQNVSLLKFRQDQGHSLRDPGKDMRRTRLPAWRYSRISRLNSSDDRRGQPLMLSPDQTRPQELAFALHASINGKRRCGHGGDSNGDSAQYSGAGVQVSGHRWQDLCAR